MTWAAVIFLWGVSSPVEVRLLCRIFEYVVGACRVGLLSLALPPSAPHCDGAMW